MNWLTSKFISLELALIILACTLAFADEKKEPANPSSSIAKAAEPACKAFFLDINTATEEQLKVLPGIVEAYAKMIIAGRPYASRNELKSKKIIPDAAYEKIKDLIVAELPKKLDPQP